MDLSEKVVRKVARKEQTAANELEPLQTAVNPDALDEIFESQQQSGMVVFSYMNYEIMVTSDEKVTLE